MLFLFFCSKISIILFMNISFFVSFKSEVYFFIVLTYLVFVFMWFKCKRVIYSLLFTVVFVVRVYVLLFFLVFGWLRMCLRFC